jgi:methylated-DNA-protein-cysteine methyltransferase related protein
LTNDGFEPSVGAVLVDIEPGTVVTYGEVAMEAGYPGAARAVGTLLARGDGDFPWWRVVASNGRLVPGHEEEHARLLRSEGVVVMNGRVAMKHRVKADLKSTREMSTDG